MLLHLNSTWSPAKSKTRPVVMTVAGIDSSGHAGLHTDIVTQRALGVHAASVVSAITAQNDKGVFNLNVTDSAGLALQWRANSIAPFHVVKSGLLASSAQIDWLGAMLSELSVPYVCDPVLMSSSGASLTLSNTREPLLSLLPHVTLLTPNIDEAEVLTGMKINDVDDMPSVANRLLEWGVSAVVIKGGHCHYHANSGEKYCVDYYASPEKSGWLASPAKKVCAVRGTGCAFASAAASALAFGYSTEDAVVIAKMAINEGLDGGYLSGYGTQGPINITQFPQSSHALPVWVDELNNLNQTYEFPRCSNTSLGLYPVVDSVDWIKTLLDAGVKTLQLRIKDPQHPELETQVESAVNLCRDYDCQLFINDYWQLAIKYGAYGVHLGQEDIATADLNAIAAAKIRLGVSSHCFYEVARAHALNPSYLATGPVFPTQSKEMPWVNQGTQGLAYWRHLIDYPLVAIGGIDEGNISEVIRCKPDGIAMISAITQHHEPAKQVKELMHLIAKQDEDHAH
ncbi:thiamine phosphate synthase [Aestuariibacter sp. AA17]|uniref:Thiamine-phosphate synthase n=1 Tax=Fluctibacter corallii TaxID=2984329 RepID=A0ABT3AC21_9ALTE|nr:thiamine phosphate synthase [Aestuariibacter sp. AA17]MCV2886226.1 thiamine phosphate synthase [Aestuariibacter sp. AA17]